MLTDLFRPIRGHLPQRGRLGLLNSPLSDKESPVIAAVYQSVGGVRVMMRHSLRTARTDKSFASSQ